MMQPAPFRADLAEGPEGARAIWLPTEDGVRIRFSIWPAGPKGRVLIFTGRTEYAEKYGRVAAGLARHGYGAMAVDWRGQGLSDRLTGNPLVGHVPAFADFQRDVTAILAFLPQIGETAAPRILAHSMGGCIGLRAMCEGMAVRAMAFSAPMWGLGLPGPIRGLARGLGWLGTALGCDHRFAPFANRSSYVQFSTFPRNLLTSDRESYDWMRRHLQHEPGFGLAGPSLRWLDEALRAGRDLASRPSPPVSALCLLGSAERVVDSAAIHKRMAAWPGGRLEQFPGARHEVLMEDSATRERAIALIAAHFDQA